MKNGKLTIREKCIGNQDIGVSFLRERVRGMLCQAACESVGYRLAEGFHALQK